MLDMRTILITYISSNAIGLGVIASLWLQNRHRLDGLGFWFANYILQFFALLLTIVRGSIPDVFSMTGSNVLAVIGTILLLIGLERFVGKRGNHIHNLVFLVLFTFTHLWFTARQPSLDARSIIFSSGLVFTCIQSAWLMLRRSDASMRPFTRDVGVVFLFYSLISFLRIFEILLLPNVDDNFFQVNIYEAGSMLTYLLLSITLTFSLFLMVNRRLFAKLESDIVEIRRSEEARRFSEDKFQKAFHASPDAILITRMRDGKIVEVNDGFSRITGYTHEEALAGTTLNLALWDSLQDRTACISELRKNQRIQEREYKFHTKTGRALIGIYSGEIIQLDGEDHILSIMHDVTARRLVEASLRESEDRFRAILQTAVDGFWMMDDDGHLLHVNETYCRMSGYTEKELLTMHINDVEINEDPEVTSAHINKVMNEGQDRFETRHRRKDGSIYDVEVSVKHQNGQFVAFLRDITERKQVEKISQELAAAEERQRLARDLHDSANQSLHSLTLFSETLTTALKKKHVSRAVKIAERLQESAQQTLKEFRLLLYQLQPARQGREPELLRDLEERLATVERRAGIRAEIIQEGTPLACSREWQSNLFWIAIEALNNSLKHAQAHAVRIIIKNSPQRVEMEISDNGRGFDPAAHDSGGMGLRTMHERAALLGGSLDILSSPGEGTQVCFGVTCK